MNSFTLCSVQSQPEFVFWAFVINNPPFSEYLLIFFFLGESFVSNLAHLPSSEAASLDNQHTDSMHNLICQLRYLLYEAEDILLASKNKLSHKKECEADAADDAEVVLCLEDLPQAKSIALCLHLLTEGLISATTEKPNSPLLFSYQCSSSTTPYLLDTFISLLQTTRRLTGAL